MSPTEATTVTSAVLRAWPLPAAGGGKDARGRVVLVGGSDQTPGAVLLAAEAALRSGAGKLQVVTAASVAPALAVALPEALVVGLPQGPGGDVDPDAADEVVSTASGAAAVLVGPGIRDVDVARELCGRVVPRLDDVGVLVLDAAAHAWVGGSRGALRRTGARALLTPNPTELALTLGVERDAVTADPARHVRELATSEGVVVAAGGEESCTSDAEGRLWVDQSGGAGLGASGSGDVQAGLITGLAARGASPAQAAVWGVHLHGRAGDRLAASVGRLGFLARELGAEVPRVLTEIEA